MFRKAFVVAGGALALLAQPVQAQTAPDEEALAALSQMFAVEPLTAEQEARLPVAQGIVARLIPPGTLGEMMGDTFDRLLGPLMQMSIDDPKAKVLSRLGLEAGDVDLGDEDAARIASLLDPDWQERNRLQAAVFPQMMGKVMAAMEPTIRSAMTELYAIHFDERELADIDAFFATPSGTAFARKSFTMSSDPRLMAASFQAMPQVMSLMGEMDKQMTAASASLPPVRSFEDLDASERKTIADMIGMSVEELGESMAAAQN